MIATVLAIDTSTPAVVAGVVRRAPLAVLAERVTPDGAGAKGAGKGRGHAELLTPTVLAALEDAGLTMADLDAVVVGCGPGPFTGLRVGMATAAALGDALGVPVYGVCSLDAIGGQTGGEVLVISDARRREVYWARYRDGVRIAGPAVDAPAAVTADAAQRRVEFAVPTPAGLVAAVADWSPPPGPPVPLYLRRPDAKTLAERAR